MIYVSQHKSYPFNDTAHAMYCEVDIGPSFRKIGGILVRQDDVGTNPEYMGSLSLKKYYYADHYQIEVYHIVM